MPAGTLGFSVLLFTISAVIAIALLIGRRNSSFCGKAELGGSVFFKLLSGGLLIILWVFYIVMSCLKEYRVIDVNF